MNATTLRTATNLVMTVIRHIAVVSFSGVTRETELAASSAGRIVLHLVCARRDHHFRWHWHGIVREFAKI